MRQILQHLRTGELEVADLPAPAARTGAVLIRTRASLISAGTERMLVEFSKANLVQKARQQPERVKQVLDKIRTDGVAPTLEAVFRKLDEPLPLGYCNAGEVVDVGRGIHDLAPGDRVISNGAHAELVCVPRNLVSPIPDGVADEAAAFTVLGSIALQGLRLARPDLGERFIVFGAGLLGLLTVQLLRANGCRVMAVDLNAERLALAESFGAETVNVASGGDPVAAAEAWTRGRGVDGALITASAKGDEIVHQAAQACRRRGRIVLVGVVGLQLRRSDFFEKELTFQVSCSYGPGRYDESYEQGGHDYPFGFVRWTEGRNFTAVLDGLADRRLQVDRLITHRYPLDRALEAYDTIRSDGTALGVILEYPAEPAPDPVATPTTATAAPEGRAVVGLVGAGGFAKAVLLPALQSTAARLAYVANRGAPAARYAARKFNVDRAVTDYREVLQAEDVNTVFIAVGHHAHAAMTAEALAAGKHVFVEKPLALDDEQLDTVLEAASAAPDRLLMVGFNRRFSPHAAKIAELLDGRSGPLCMSMTVNAGAIPAEHWIQDPERGGGRVIGEACHFIDLMVFLAGAGVRRVSAVQVAGGSAVTEDKTAILLGFADGSVGTINYFANGAKSYPKERLEVFSDGRVLVLDNFRALHGHGFNGFRKLRTSRQDKGHQAEVQAFIDRVADGGSSPIPLDQLENVTRASFLAVRAAREGRTFDL
jgi:predicted dehydrogenase/threonine dehydrogenase-like Zn-dependent dehydrogenase